MTSESTRYRTDPNGSSNTNTTSSQSAAVRGASLAFGKQAVNAKKEAGSNGALAAAVRAGQNQRSASASLSAQHTGLSSQGGSDRLASQGTGGSVRNGIYTGSAVEPGLVKQRLNQLVRVDPDHLQPPRPGLDSRSPSHIAATLAASRSGSLSPNITGQSVGRPTSTQPPYNVSPRGHVAQRSSSLSRNIDENVAEDAVDTTTIPPTTSLIGMFERSAEITSTKKLSKTQPTLDSTKAAKPAAPVIASPKPKPQVISISAPKVAKSSVSEITPTKSKPRPVPVSIIKAAKSKGPEILSPKPIATHTPAFISKPILPPPVQPRMSNKTSPINSRPIPINTSNITRIKDDNDTSSDSSRVLLPPPVQPRRSNKALQTIGTQPITVPGKAPAYRTEDDDASSDDSFVSASDQPQPKAPPKPRRSMSASTKVRNNHVLPQDALTINSMADAIVASSLASSRSQTSSRVGSPSKPQLPSRHGTPSLPPPPHRRQQGYKSPRPPSPPKAFRTTMRKEPKKGKGDEEDVNLERTTRRHMLGMKKHPNKHHEGDRKRWRDMVTERERKRYEAVWASNRGILLPADPLQAQASGSSEMPMVSYQLKSQQNAFSSTVSLQGASTPGLDQPLTKKSDRVHALVVRDIYSRSRLPTDTLSEVWDLVDRSGDGTLAKEEFVAGLWLIDQRLKGRKLPVRVGEGVWGSLGALSGVRIKERGRGR